MKPSNNTDISIGHWNQNTNVEHSIPHEQLFRHTAIIGSGGIGKTTHQINVMKQLAENGHGFCFINCTDFDIETLCDVLPAHRMDDVTTIREYELVASTDLEPIINNDEILIIERTAFHQPDRKQYTQFLQRFWNTAQELDLDEHSYVLFIDRFHRMADVDVNYSDMLALARGEGLALHISTMYLARLPDDVREALFSQAENVLALHYLNNRDVELLSDRTGLPSENFTNLGRFKAWVDTPRTDEPALVDLSDPTQAN